MSAMQRRKGASYEREVCKDLSDAFGGDYARNLGQARDGGCDIPVPRFNGGAYLVECKRRRRIAVEAFLKQCELACGPAEIPLVVMRVDGGESMALMRWRDLLPLLGNEVAPKIEEEAK